MTSPDLSRLAVPGARIAVRVTPRAGLTRVVDGDPVRIYVTTVPEDGKATAAAIEVLARAMGVAKTRIHLARGAKSRDKVFGFD
ncbi:DUF167 domain-containing protein [Oceaniglobus indicus]|uniref:DUF167 domain-containing protein n=1 Tax=Oceaniglobus indicus TaxID=2047749 RepID=UPI000C1944A4|nr:DUF167 domain-containing protein [Oceaniglobus indicus]